MEKEKSLIFRIILVYILLTLSVYMVLYVVAVRYMDAFVKETARQTADGISKQVFSSMYQVMKRGWERRDLLEFMKALEVSYQGTPVNINIYRSDLVKEIYGTVPEPAKGKLHFLALKGEPQNKFEGGVYLYIKPVKAEAECLRCHWNAQEGSVLGLVETSINMQSFVSNVRHTLKALIVGPLIAFSLVLTFILLTLRGLLRQLSRKISESIENIRSIEDVENLHKSIEDSYRELKPVYESLQHLGERIKSIAIDREILDMEAKLLERFIITSKTIKNWHDYVKNLIDEMNQIIPIDIVFTLFLEPEVLKVEIFWYKKADERTERYIEAFIKSKITLELPVSLLMGRQLRIMHHTVNGKEIYSEEDKEKIRLRTKAVFFDKPQIGGIVGLGVESCVMDDVAKQAVLNSLLSTLVNTIGSSKAISDYIEQVEFYAMRDPLTTLYNQRTFWELLSYEIERAKRFDRKLSLIILDLDNFKFINDTYGHHVGDMLLKEVARVVGERKRKSDIAARYGGDEFVIIAVGADPLNAYALASSLKEQIESITLNLPDGSSISPRVSMGIAVYPEHGETPKDLFLIADSMLRNAKEEGKGKIRLPSQEELVQSYREYSSKAIRVLTAFDKGEIVPFFQPIVDLRSGEVFGNEVLMRIGDNLAPAGEFIEMAERLGIVLKMDMQVYEKAFKKAYDAHYRGKLFLNLSPRAMLVENFIENMKDLIRRYNMEPSQVVFELTERESIKNISLLERFIRKLKEEGFLFAIDDFGSGYSSFHYIKKLPVDFVKLEGEFVRDVLEDWRDRIFIESVVTLARGMGMKTIAEHVENGEVLKILKDLKVDYAQGYYIGKPSERLV